MLKGKKFTKIIKEIIIAAKEGGGDAESNARLRLAVQNAKAPICRKTILTGQ